MDSIVVTGLGIVSALGTGVEATVEHLLAGQSGIGKIKYLDTRHCSLPAGEVPMDDSQMREFLEISSEKAITRTSLMGRIALREAVMQAQLCSRPSRKVSLVSGTTVGGMEKSERFYHDFLQNNERNEYIALHDCGACTDMIAHEFPGMFDFQTTISTACSSAANAVILGANLLHTGRADVVVAGGSECLSKFHLDGFHTLMILDEAPCKPFDKNRNGLNLGEGAAYIVMELAENAEKRGVTPLCRLSGYANRCDAFHQTASSPEGEGAYRSMMAALECAKLQPSEISYINAHGTGTPNNDESEGKAMMRVFGTNVPPVSSTKAFTGHTTSAGGGVENVISILALTRDFIPANLNFSEKIESLNFVPVLKVQSHVQLQHVLTNSFGFGGNDSSCIFSKIQSV
ncbi:MAG: beta-ketoacyl-[acyl-carrier-protein] synthase family protein [Bacteroidales bacterium]|nr:beta-ketoacyl-[acyl-carrier-protein] synthase family protein [Bacteroidales bacterium]